MRETRLKCTKAPLEKRRLRTPACLPAVCTTFSSQAVLWCVSSVSLTHTHQCMPASMQQLFVQQQYPCLCACVYAAVPRCVPAQSKGSPVRPCVRAYPCMCACTHEAMYLQKMCIICEHMGVCIHPLRVWMYVCMHGGIYTCRKYVARSMRFQMLSHRLGPYSMTVQASM